MWCRSKLCRVPWTAWRSNQSILKDINLEYSLEGLMLKFQYFGHLMRRTDSLEKTLMMGKIEGRRRRGRQRMKWLNGITDSMDMSLSKVWESVKDREGWCAAVPKLSKSWTQQLNHTDTQNLGQLHRPGGRKPMAPGPLLTVESWARYFILFLQFSHL